MYTTSWCGDCRRAKKFLKQRNLEYSEVNIDEDADAEDLMIRVNNGKRRSVSRYGCRNRGKRFRTGLHHVVPARAMDVDVNKTRHE